MGDNIKLDNDKLRAINTGAPYIADKVMDYKKEIWNEALTYLGINNIMVDKKERLVSDEANSNNELINLNLQSFLAPRKLACKQFNEKFGLTGSDKEISVRVRSDLHNIIKNEEATQDRRTIIPPQYILMKKSKIPVMAQSAMPRMQMARSSFSLRE